MKLKKKQRQTQQGALVPQSHHLPMVVEPQLEVISGPEEGVLYRLRGSEITIGRGKENDITLEDSQASRLHALIVLEEGKFFLKDLDSQNGITVNGKTVSLCELENGDRISIGETTFQFTLPGGQELAESTFLEGVLDDLGPVRPRPFRVIPMILLGLVGLVIYWALTSGTKDQGQGTETREPFSVPTIPLAPPFEEESLGVRIQQENMVSADHLYQQGFRELMATNYLRAITFFEAALTLYPSHQSAKQKLTRAFEEISREVDKEFQLGRRYFENHHWERAVFHFERAKLLLGKKTDSQVYVESDKLALEARERLNPPKIEPIVGVDEE